MEIPYISKSRPDTGLYNAKLGIWLFLASEVMLFGALFSTYVLLRVGAAQGTWPHHLLNIWLGATNTIVLIISSVTVVLSWAALKMNKWGTYKFTQAITILCSLIFLGIKSYEYRDKFSHYYIKLKDGKEMTGHIEGSPLLWNKAKLESLKITEFKFHPEAAHSEAAAKVAEGAKAPEAPAHAEQAAHAEHAAEVIKVEDIQQLHCFGPWHNTYLAIYFTLTGLHALHVIGGALVIFMIWGPLAGMWKTDPERYTNRVEVSGLFWHFVDLVWIFLFPVLYLL
ncbi:MAG: cyoC [Verrucomicrobiales bacterium]|nr:cyoC [Verrucomicrobiales bacterium]